MVDIQASLLSIPRNTVTAVGLPFITNFIISALTTRSHGSPRDGSDLWYRTLRKPSLQPPPAVFPITWTILYASMGYASRLLCQTYDGAAPGSSTAQGALFALKLYAAQLGLNALWSPLFFGAHKIGTALADICVLTPLTYYFTYQANKVDPRTTIFLAPYCLWLTFATYLNASIYLLNRK